MKPEYLSEIVMKSLPEKESYLWEIPALQSLFELGKMEFKKQVTFFVGENGAGKSTLLEAIAVMMGFNAEGGSRDFNFSTFDSHSELYQYLSPVRRNYPKDGFFLRAESFYNASSYIELNGNIRRYGGTSFHERSHGEAFMDLVSNRFEGNGLYLLDEPEAALSPQRLLSLLVAIDNLVKSNSQFIIATHSPILMAYPDAEILQFDEYGIHPVEYKETDQYLITKQFLDNPQHMIDILLEK